MPIVPGNARVASRSSVLLCRAAEGDDVQQLPSLHLAGDSALFISGMAATTYRL